MTTVSEPIAGPTGAAGSLAEPISLRAAVAAVSALGAAALWVPPTWDAPTSLWLPPLAVLTVLSILLEFVIVRVPAGARLSLATAPHVASVLLVPAPFAAISISLAVLVKEAARGSSSAGMLFNVAAAALTASVASAVMGLLGSMYQAEAAGTTAVLPPLFGLVAAAYLGTHALLASARTSLTRGGSVWTILRRRAQAGLPGDLAVAATGALLAAVWLVQPLLLLVLATPAAVVVWSLQHARRPSAKSPNAVRFLADVVDRRDATTEGHSARVAAVAARLARALEVPEPEVRAIEQAASVHDVGKTCVPDAVLLKPGRLTGAETAAMRRHSVVGAEIVARLGASRRGVEIVRHHHERWDGGGYPDGLAGEAIPLGARIVAVADAYDAMTSARRYRRALSRREEQRRLASGAGTQWDPRVVDAYLALAAGDGAERRTERRERRSASRPLMGRPAARRPAARERRSGESRRAS